MIKKIFTISLVSSFIYMAYSFHSTNAGYKGLKLYNYYQKNAVSEFASNNIVSSIVVSYRGLDTLGEVTILFLSALLISFIAGFKSKNNNIDIGSSINTTSEILETASSFLTPFIFILGLYIIINGHLTPGGGFQGGAIFATGLIFLLITNINYKVRKHILKYVESLSGVFYVILALIGLFVGIGFLNPKLLPLGTVGNIFSAGLIPVIYIFIGMKVGAELSLIFYNFEKKRNI